MIFSTHFLGQVSMVHPIHHGQWGAAATAAIKAKQAAQEAQTASNEVNTSEAQGWAAKADDPADAEAALEAAEKGKATVLALQATPIPAVSPTSSRKTGTIASVEPESDEPGAKLIRIDDSEMFGFRG